MAFPQSKPLCYQLRYCNYLGVIHPGRPQALKRTMSHRVPYQYHKFKWCIVFCSLTYCLLSEANFICGPAVSPSVLVQTGFVPAARPPRWHLYFNGSPGPWRRVPSASTLNALHAHQGSSQKASDGRSLAVQLLKPGRPPPRNPVCR